jgi:AbrB family looped-hinge helix DNA binding protein
MKAGKTKKIVKGRIKSRRQIILGEALGTDRERVKPFTEDDRGEDREFTTSLLGFRYMEEKHEASRYLSKTRVRVTLSTRGRMTIPREVRTRLDIKPGQMVSITAVDGAVHIVPIRQSRRSERGRSFS